MDVEDICGTKFYTYNVYRMFLGIFPITVFVVEGESEEQCIEECKRFAQEVDKGKLSL